MITCTIKNLINGEIYYVRVYVVNPHGFKQSETTGQIASATPMA